MATAADLADLLASTTLPADLATELIAGAPALWLASNTSAVLAGDLALCHPALKPAEVRARCAPYADGSSWRLTVAAHDRPGLLADTAASLASRQHSVLTASVATWVDLDLALHAVTVAGRLPADDELAAIGAGLRASGNGSAPAVQFVPAGGATVTSAGAGMGRAVVNVSATDQVGLLWAICRWFAGRGISIEAASIGGADGMAEDVFVVATEGDPDVEQLTAYL